MPDLRRLQLSFAEAMLGNDTVPVPHVTPGRFGASRHLQVYRNNILASLTAALEAVYPVVARLVGSDFFQQTARLYARAHPPERASLHAFGATFADFLAGYAPAQGLSYLPDVARLEWAIHEVYHGTELGTPSLDRLRVDDPQSLGALRLALAPNVRLLTSGFPFVRIWEVNQPGYSGDETIDLALGAEHVLVVRPELDVELYRLSAGEHAWLAAHAGGSSFARALVAAMAADTGFDLEAALRRFVLPGLVVIQETPLQS